MTARAHKITHIAPTHACFDDVAVYFHVCDPAELRRHFSEYRIVHARVAVAGHAYAHAWIECAGLLWQAGIAHGDGFEPHPIFYAIELGADRGFTVEREWRYTIPAALAEATCSGGSSGPWAPELRALSDAATAARARGESGVVGETREHAPIVRAFRFDRVAAMGALGT